MSTARRLIAPVSVGLGDLVVSLPVIQAAVRTGARTGVETWLVSRSPVQTALAPRIGGLAGTVAEADLVLRPSDELVDLRDHPLQRDHWWGSEEFEAAYGPLSINEVVARIGADRGITSDISRPEPLEFEARADAAGLVLLITDCDGPAKRWPDERWAALATKLAQGGVAVAVLTRGDGRNALVGRGLAELAASTPGQVVDALSSCRAAVGVDTGPTHVAAQQGTPTVTICRSPAFYFRDWRHTRLVAGSRCDLACQIAEKAYADDQRRAVGTPGAPRRCPSATRCLDPIDPDSVLTAMEELW